ncbi:sugar ABC transporter ATP-binding protein [Sinorhizobium meliloti]|uniref:sugar ABC transporter ATP-binding protein n=1 Tax=Rhizobium meliloti TaxID=382 RepID=UPI00398CF922
MHMRTDTSANLAPQLPSTPFLACNGLTKSFGAVNALRGVDFRVDRGRVRGLIGENGAGKSTLVKIIAGVQRPDDGTMTLNGRRLRFANTNDAIRAGIVTVHQDINLVQTMTVAENLMLNNEPCRRFGVIEGRRLEQTVVKLLQQYEVDVAPNDDVSRLSNDRKKMVQIIKGIALRPDVLLLDEPTSSLTEHEVEVVLGLIRRLADDRVGVVLISHYLNEIFDVCHDLTVMRDGAVVWNGAIATTTRAEAVASMVGQRLDAPQRRAAAALPFADDGVLKVERIGIPRRVEPMSFTLRRGEILGITGLAGSGLDYIAKLIFGAAPNASRDGRVAVNGVPVPPGQPAAAVRAGIALITGDRHGEGVLLGASLEDNICLAVIDRFAGFLGRLDHKAMRRTARSNMERLRVRAPGPNAAISQLSGGNQQKVLIAKWLETNPKVFILQDPTIGVDVGAKAEIRAIIDDMLSNGVGIVLITTELEDLVSMCDRVLVVFRGALVAELSGGGITRETILHIASCGAAEERATA